MNIPEIATRCATEAIDKHAATVPRYQCPNCARMLTDNGVTNPNRYITATKCCGYVARNVVTPPGIPCIAAAVEAGIREAMVAVRAQIDAQMTAIVKEYAPKSNVDAYSISRAGVAAGLERADAIIRKALESEGT